MDSPDRKDDKLPGERMQFEMRVGNRTYYGNLAIRDALSDDAVQEAIRSLVITEMISRGFPPHRVGHVELNVSERYMEVKYREARPPAVPDQVGEPEAG